MKTIIKAVIKIIALLFGLQLLSPLVSSIGGTVMAYTHDRQYGLIHLAIALFVIIIIGLVLYFGWWKTDKIVRLIAGDLG
jgi:xanthine/uracil permease